MSREGHPGWRRGHTKREKVKTARGKAETKPTLKTLLDYIRALEERIEFLEGE